MSYIDNFFRVLPVKLDPLDQLANAALLEKLDPWVLKDLK